MKRQNTWLWAIGGLSAIALGWYAFSKRNERGSTGGDAGKLPANSRVDRDWEHLQPTFRLALEELFRRLKGLGWDPCLHEGLRSRSRAETLAASGIQASKDSMHLYGVAADVVSCSQGWSNPAFFKAMNREAVALGLYLVSGDANHVQAVPTTNLAQNAVREAADPDTVVRQYLLA